MADEKKVTVLNRGVAPHVVSMNPRKVVKPGESVELPAKEAEKLLRYPGMVDLAKVAPGQADEMDALRKENAALKEAAKAKGGKADGEKDKKPEGEKDKKDAAGADKSKDKAPK